MDRDSTNQALRQIRTLYALGPVGGLTDAQLVGRFLSHDGADREDAFAALVQRHGPMVLRVCRRMLPGSADADDAFQAVFLVLARKAGAVRRTDMLKPWLYGVAVRTAKEARRRAAKRREKEGGPVDESKAVSTSDGGRGEWLALLDEEIDRLPSRYRDPLVLCELEGVSRHDAARQLGLPEGTLSSRLSRGRSLLRDRLTRRGVALGAGLSAGLIAEPAGAALPEPLADSAVRLALKFASGGAGVGSVPAAVASLAEGVLAMLSAAKLKLILVATAALGATTCLTAVLARPAVPGGGDEPPAKPPAAVKAQTTVNEGKPKPPQTRVHGVVVDEAGRPVAGAEVRVKGFSNSEALGTTAADGSFSVAVRHRLFGTVILARSPGGDRLGLFAYVGDVTGVEAEAEKPARVVLKPARNIVVRVAGADKAPVAGATVEAAGNYTALDTMTTGADGSARLGIPADARVEWIVAVKPGRGFDYAEYGPIDGQGRSQSGAPAAELPASVALTLEGGRTARIKAVDRDGKPLAGVGFYPWLLHKEGRRSQVNYSSRALLAETGPDGVATFDWLPPVKNLQQFWPVTERYSQRRVIVNEGEVGTVSTKMSRTEAIGGRVVRADGAPAPGVRVQAFGSGQGLDHGQGRARTAADGSYEMNVDSGEAYVVFVDDKDWTAPTRLDVVVREGHPVSGVDFTLTRGTVLRGTVTVGPGNRPAPGQFIQLYQKGGEAPRDLREPGDRYGHLIQRQISVTTGADGRYSVRVGPGTYTLVGPPRTKEDETLTVKDEPELVRDYRMPRLEKGPISGRVVHAGRGVAGATVEIIAATLSGGFPTTARADAEGRFRVDRTLDKGFLWAHSPDGSLGAIVEIGAEDPEAVVEVNPTATASGRLLDESGKPAANTPVSWGRRIDLGEEHQVTTNAFAPRVKTDAEGRFTLPSLVVGQEYNISLEREGTYHAAGVVRPEKAGAIDLGTLRAGAYNPPGSASAREESSFRKNAPDAGRVAPPVEATTLDGKPLALADFKGKYVLLDFWATWCGPCLAEIPRLQDVHAAFGADGRFAILSLSVDESIAEPKKFQEARKLPWPQAFLGGGVHGPTPAAFGVRAIPAFVLVGPDGKIVARGMRGDDIKKEVARALAKTP